MNAPDKTGTDRRAVPAAVDLDALIRAEHRDPFSILGPHDDGKGGRYVRAYLPAALS
ncbi:glycogen branching enzyme, partial [Pseudomonas syringae pv. actinidiae ICMP 18804]